MTAPTIILRPAADLAPYAKNARTHSVAQIEQLKASFRQFGFNTPLGVDDEGILVGHGRLAAAQAMWAAGEDVPGPGKREPLPRGMVPTLDLTGLSPDERKAYIIADNQLALNAGWDFNLLAEELRSLAAADFDMPVIGFDGDYLADLLFAPDEGLADPDAAPALEAKAVTRVGDMWVLGDHRILCGDCTVATDVDRLLDGEVPVLMATDPPYGVEYDPTWRKTAKLAGKVAEGKVQNDDRADWREAWALFPGRVAYVWHGGLHAAAVAASLEAVKLVPRAQIVWVKGRAAISRGAYHWQHEPAFYAVREGEDDAWQGTGFENGDSGGLALDKPQISAGLSEDSKADVPSRFAPDHEAATYAVRKGEPARFRGGRKQTTVWNIDHLKNDTGHGTQKPVECMRRPILNNSAVGDVVYEPFSGSGTTIIAGEMTGRKVRAIEIDPRYVDVAIRRWQDFTGQQAVLAGEGWSFSDLEAGR